MGDFATLDKDPDQNKMARKNVEVFINGIKTEDTKLIACKAIISQNYASNFTGMCSHLLAQVALLHGGAQLESQRYKQRILVFIHVGGGCGGGRGCGI